MAIGRFACALLLVLLTATGCLERNEHLTIRPDGSALIELRYRSATDEDIYEGDAVPRMGHGWAVEQRKHTDASRSEELYAVRLVEPAEALPSSYAPPGEEERSQALRFPTEVRIEHREDGTYYHFQRRYEARRWAYVNIKKQELIDEPMKEFAGVDPSTLTEADAQRVMHSIAMFEVAKALIFARESHLDVAPGLPQDWWLAFAAEIERIPDEVEYAHLIELSRDPNDQQKAQQFNAEVERWQQELKDRIERAAREKLHYTGSQLNRFLSKFEELNREFAIAEDLNDDTFDIAVTMPGEVVATNAGETVGDTLRWKFVGAQLFDSSLELMATSVVR